MSLMRYEVTEHDGGWAYKVDDVYSETFATREQAEAAAERAAREQTIGDRDADIEYQDAEGKWHVEHARGSDRPSTEVEH